jgi:hypothetical protein
MFAAIRISTSPRARPYNMGRPAPNVDSDHPTRSCSRVVRTRQHEEVRTPGVVWVSRRAGSARSPCRGRIQAGIFVHLRECFDNFAWLEICIDNAVDCNDSGSSSSQHLRQHGLQRRCRHRRALRATANDVFVTLYPLDDE